ncbi:hypothetical protein KF707_13105 [Candidatus Obscuribacterales bacterium]|nr:hypothetical protein [Candidatus Obscuribacterales bacterium]MBX3137173.1 hypothetical protein [Candidatus Obscuribacterales bacterium]MBX3153943.1 hypothetical protein [Candidatus Obscuribacterales bacterium]
MVSSTISLAGVPAPEESKATAQAVPLEKAKPYPWIVNPWFDFLFVYGGALWGVFALHYFLFGWNNLDTQLSTSKEAFAIGTIVMMAGILGQHIFADTHTIATYMRIYATPESRKTFRLYAYYLPWLSLSLFVMACIWKEAAGTVVYLHMMWVFQHYVGQCFGVALIYCYKRGYFMNNFERETFRWFMHSLSYVIITRILCHREYSPYVYWGVDVPFWGLPLWLYDLGIVCFTVMTTLFVGVVVRKWHREGMMMPFPAICQVLTVAAIGWSVGMASSMIWQYGPNFFHGSQYLAISLGFYIKEKGLQEGMLSKDVFKNWFSPRSMRYWAYVIVAGMFVYIFVPHFMMYFGLTFGLVATVIQACINFHHFVSDAAIWRLRDARCRDVLIA